MKLEIRNGEIIIQTRRLTLVLDETACELAQIRTPSGDYNIQVSHGELIVNGFVLDELLKEKR